LSVFLDLEKSTGKVPPFCSAFTSTVIPNGASTPHQKFSGTRDPLCFLADNNVLWTLTSIKTDFAPNEWGHCGCSCHAISTSKTLSNKSFSERDSRAASRTWLIRDQDRPRF
jgi:hypothetical protein